MSELSDEGERALTTEGRESPLAERVKALAVAMSGVGEHRDPCRLPDTPCLCGVCDFRVEAVALVRALLG